MTASDTIIEENFLPNSTPESNRLHSSVVDFDGTPSNNSTNNEIHTPQSESHQHTLSEYSLLLAPINRTLRRLSAGTNKIATNSLSVNGHVFSRYRQSRFNARRVRKRVVFKHGDCNVTQENVAKRRRRYLQDIFTTLVDAQWRWTLLVFALNFLLSWLGFATVWWLIAYIHGDLQQEEGQEVEPHSPCVTNVHGFMTAFLFSVETQHTIGYGVRATTEHCPLAVLFMCLQSIVGVMIQAFMVGVVFAKLSRPKKRTQTLLFSRHAVIAHRDGTPCFMFRVGDMRKSHIVEAHVRAQLIHHKVTREGEHLPFCQTELKVGGDGEEDKIFFIWPTTIVHKIDKSSPLYTMSATDLLRERFEIVVVLEGVIESTGMTTQARSSYLPSEILWGHRFQSLITFRKLSGEYQIDYALFNNTIEVDTPMCSAKQLEEYQTLPLTSPAADEAKSTLNTNSQQRQSIMNSSHQSTETLSSTDSLSATASGIIQGGTVEMHRPIPPVIITDNSESTVTKDCISDSSNSDNNAKQVSKSISLPMHSLSIPTG